MTYNYLLHYLALFGTIRCLSAWAVANCVSYRWAQKVVRKAEFLKHVTITTLPSHGHPFEISITMSGMQYINSFPPEVLPCSQVMHFADSSSLPTSSPVF
jgi:hypothetical protein